MTLLNIFSHLSPISHPLSFYHPSIIDHTSFIYHTLSHSITPITPSLIHTLTHNITHITPSLNFHLYHILSHSIFSTPPSLNSHPYHILFHSIFSIPPYLNSHPYHILSLSIFSTPPYLNSHPYYSVQGDRLRLIALTPILRVRLKNNLSKGRLGFNWDGNLEYVSVSGWVVNIPLSPSLTHAHTLSPPGIHSSYDYPPSICLLTHLPRYPHDPLSNTPLTHL